MIELRLFRASVAAPTISVGIVGLRKSSRAELFDGAFPDTEMGCVLRERHSDPESHQPLLCDKAVQSATAAFRVGDVDGISH